MTDMLMMLQRKHPAEDHAAMIAALKTVRDHDEGESDKRLVRQFLDQLNRTSIGTEKVCVARANVSASRLADILGRAIEQPDKAD